MRHTTLMLASTVSFFTITVATAQAQSISSDYRVSVEGAFLFGRAFSFVSDTDRNGFNPRDTDNGSGWSGAFSVSKSLGDMRDLTARMSAASVRGHDESVQYLFDATTSTINSFGSGSGGASRNASDVNFQTFDLEYGMSDDTSVRLFGGLRVFHFNDDTSSVLNDRGTGVGSNIVPIEPFSSPTTTIVGVGSEFWGVGPRAGVDFERRMENSIFGISGMAAVSVLIGSLDTKTSAMATIDTGGPSPIFPTFNPGPGNSSSQFVFNAEAAIGLDLHISDSTLLTFGYKVQNFWNARDSSPLYETSFKDYLSHGVFVRLSGQI